MQPPNLAPTFSLSTTMVASPPIALATVSSGRGILGQEDQHGHGHQHHEGLGGHLVALKGFCKEKCRQISTKSHKKWLLS